MVRKVVIPASTSVRTVVPNSSKWKNRASMASLLYYLKMDQAL